MRHGDTFALLFFSTAYLILFKFNFAIISLRDNIIITTTERRRLMGGGGAFGKHVYYIISKIKND